MSNNWPARESEIISEAMAALARRSNAAQKRRYGRAYSAEMSRRGKKGGRPPKTPQAAKIPARSP